MIEKLSDAVLADIKANACNSGMSIEDAIRAFYDTQIDKQGQDIAKAFQILLAYGVTEERAGTVANGIDVLVTRLGKETQALLVNQRNDFHDAQAKTMDELERIYRDNFYSCGSNEAFKYARLKGYDTRQVNSFEGMVSCFLAAGGTIKDGES
jgi:hypothetical protein